MPHTTRSTGMLLLGIAALAWPVAAQTAPEGLELRANFETIAVKVPCDPADFPNAEGRLDYREKGASEWKPAHRLARLTSPPT